MLKQGVRFCNGAGFSTPPGIIIGFVSFSCFCFVRSFVCFFFLSLLCIIYQYFSLPQLYFSFGVIVEIIRCSGDNWYLPHSYKKKKGKKWSEIELTTRDFVSSVACRSLVLIIHFRTSQSARKNSSVHAAFIDLLVYCTDCCSFPSQGDARLAFPWLGWSMFELFFNFGVIVFFIIVWKGVNWNKNLYWVSEEKFCTQLTERDLWFMPQLAVFLLIYGIGWLLSVSFVSLSLYSHWLLKIFSFLLIGRQDYFRFGYAIERRSIPHFN